jgi:adenylate cyclase
MSTDTQRRLVAIFAADVEGYSRLMGTDEVGTLRDLTQRRAILDGLIASHRGRIANTAGDSVLAEFGSAADAVQCAVEAQTSLAEANVGLKSGRHINFRIGVHVGDVMVKDGDLFGDGVNIAARLQTLARAGGVCISGSTHEHVRKILPLAFTDLGTQQVKNIEEAVRAYAVSAADNLSARAAAGNDLPLSLSDKPSIAVLPFVNISGDPAQDYFSDGITEDTITELSRFRSLFVVARNSSFTYKGKAVDIKQVGRELGVRYVVEGSVRKTGKRVRVTIQLLDAASGYHLWGERYDRELEDIFVLQDEIVGAVVSALPGRLEAAGRDLARRKQTSSITAYDFVPLGNERWRHLTGKDLAEARENFRSAVALDPQYARAHANIAWTHVCDVFLESPATMTLDDALREIETALDIDDSDAWSHGVFAQLLFLRKEDDQAEIHFNRALAFNPNDADVAAVFANILVYWGRWREALTWIGAAKRLNPFPPNLYHWYHALALYSGHEYEQAVKALKETRSLDHWSHGLLAACYAQMGRLEEARSESDAFVRERHRGLSENGEAPPANDLDLARARADRYRNPIDREHFLDGLRKAGLTG